MERLIIESTPNGEDGEAVEIGTVDASDFRCDRGLRGTGVLGMRGSHELRKVLSQGFSGGYGQRVFHLRAGDRLLENCHVDGADGDCIRFHFDGPAK